MQAYTTICYCEQFTRSVRWGTKGLSRMVRNTHVRRSSSIYWVDRSKDHMAGKGHNSNYYNSSQATLDQPGHRPKHKKRFHRDHSTSSVNRIWSETKYEIINKYSRRNSTTFAGRPTRINVACVSKGQKFYLYGSKKSFSIELFGQETKMK